jgi:hypothetical protein
MIYNYDILYIIYYISISLLLITFVDHVLHFWSMNIIQYLPTKVINNWRNPPHLWKIGGFVMRTWWDLNSKHRNGSWGLDWINGSLAVMNFTQIINENWRGHNIWKDGFWIFTLNIIKWKLCFKPLKLLPNCVGHHLFLIILSSFIQIQSSIKHFIRPLGHTAWLKGGSETNPCIIPRISKL